MKSVLPGLTAMALAMPLAVQAPALAKVPENPLRAELKQPVIKWTCVHAGKRLDQGAKACLNTPAGPRLAICSMVLNNTSWQTTPRPCTPGGVN